MLRFFLNLRARLKQELCFLPLKDDKLSLKKQSLLLLILKMDKLEEDPTHKVVREAYARRVTGQSKGGQGGGCCSENTRCRGAAPFGQDRFFKKQLR